MTEFAPLASAVIWSRAHISEMLAAMRDALLRLQK
jgi:hypothetical protein